MGDTLGAIVEYLERNNLHRAAEALRLEMSQKQKRPSQKLPSHKFQQSSPPAASAAAAAAASSRPPPDPSDMDVNLFLWMKQDQMFNRGSGFAGAGGGASSGGGTGGGNSGGPGGGFAGFAGFNAIARSNTAPSQFLEHAGLPWSPAHSPPMAQSPSATPPLSQSPSATPPTQSPSATPPTQSPSATPPGRSPRQPPQTLASSGAPPKSEHPFSSAYFPRSPSLPSATSLPSPRSLDVVLEEDSSLHAAALAEPNSSGSAAGVGAGSAALGSAAAGSASSAPSDRDFSATGGEEAESCNLVPLVPLLVADPILGLTESPPKAAPILDISPSPPNAPPVASALDSGFPRLKPIRLSAESRDGVNLVASLDFGIGSLRESRGGGERDGGGSDWGAGGSARGSGGSAKDSGGSARGSAGNEFEGVGGLGEVGVGAEVLEFAAVPGVGGMGEAQALAQVVTTPQQQGQLGAGQQGAAEERAAGIRGAQPRGQQGQQTGQQGLGQLQRQASGERSPVGSSAPSSAPSSPLPTITIGPVVVGSQVLSEEFGIRRTHGAGALAGGGGSGNVARSLESTRHSPRGALAGAGGSGNVMGGFSQELTRSSPLELTRNSPRGGLGGSGGSGSVLSRSGTADGSTSVVTRSTSAAAESDAGERGPGVDYSEMLLIEGSGSDSDAYEEEEDVGYVRRLVEDEERFLLYELDSETDDEKGSSSKVSVGKGEGAGVLKDEKGGSSSKGSEGKSMGEGSALDKDLSVREAEKGSSSKVAVGKGEGASALKDEKGSSSSKELVGKSAGEGSALDGGKESSSKVSVGKSAGEGSALEGSALEGSALDKDLSVREAMEGSSRGKAENGVKMTSEAVQKGSGIGEGAKSGSGAAGVAGGVAGVEGGEKERGREGERLNDAAEAVEGGSDFDLIVDLMHTRTSDSGGLDFSASKTTFEAPQKPMEGGSAVDLIDTRTSGAGGVDGGGASKSADRKGGRGVLLQNVIVGGGTRGSGGGAGEGAEEGQRDDEQGGEGGGGAGFGEDFGGFGGGGDRGGRDKGGGFGHDGEGGGFSFHSPSSNEGLSRGNSGWSGLGEGLTHPSLGSSGAAGMGEIELEHELERMGSVADSTLEVWKKQASGTFPKLAQTASGNWDFAAAGSVGGGGGEGRSGAGSARSSVGRDRRSRLSVDSVEVGEVGEVGGVGGVGEEEKKQDAASAGEAGRKTAVGKVAGREGEDRAAHADGAEEGAGVEAAEVAGEKAGKGSGGAGSAEKKAKSGEQAAEGGNKEAGKGKVEGSKGKDEEEFETFNLRVIHRKNRTGFEEDKDFPVVLNSVIAGRYYVTEYLGAAAFSKAIQAHDLHTGMDVCLKIIKNNKDFFDQSLDEIKLLKFINMHDPADEHHLLRMYDYFYHREHLFIICELLRANLYEFHKYSPPFSSPSTSFPFPILIRCSPPHPLAGAPLYHMRVATSQPEHLFIICELLRANLYEFHKYSPPCSSPSTSFPFPILIRCSPPHPLAGAPLYHMRVATSQPEHLFIICELLRANLYEFHKYSPPCSSPSTSFPFRILIRIQSIAKQILKALSFMHSLGLIHCDLKPENILIKSYSRCLVKVIDIGSSCFTWDALCSYVQSRSYRAPEVILGLPYGPKIDVWLLGCILAELCSGQVLFQNDSLATLLARVVGIIGPMDPTLLRRAKDAHKYFTRHRVLYERNPETDALEYLIPKRTSLKHRLPMGDEGFLEFVAFLLQVDPDKRPTADEALLHPWMSHEYDPIT
ncbi:unnamed protein product [Closterium sp. Naga37s-1]|nr:unnamed protein product [Closterium sp. Naga37s-1]